MRKELADHPIEKSWKETQRSNALDRQEQIGR